MLAKQKPAHIAMALLALVLIGTSVGGYINNQPHNGLRTKKLAEVRLSFSYPANWKVTDDEEGVDSGFFELVAPDGFQLGFTIAKVSAFTKPDNTILQTTGTKVVEVINTNQVGEALVYADSGTYPYHSIAVTTNPLKVGDTFYTGDESDEPINPAVKGLGVAINGGFRQGFTTLTAFDNQASVKQAKLIYQSLRYY